MRGACRGGGFELWLDSIPYVIGAGLLPALVFIFGARSHKYWTVCFFFYAGCALLVAYVLAVAFALAVVAGVVRERDPGLAVMPVVGLVILTALGLAAWVLLRALRLRYRQPWRVPQSWEPGDEGPTAWAMSPGAAMGREGGGGRATRWRDVGPKRSYTMLLLRP